MPLFETGRQKMELSASQIFVLNLSFALVQKQNSSSNQTIKMLMYLSWKCSCTCRGELFLEEDTGESMNVCEKPKR